ncbi:hypothetical protein V6N13_069443 [Hibiscus sabdariffa]
MASSKKIMIKPPSAPSPSVNITLSSMEETEISRPSDIDKCPSFLYFIRFSMLKRINIVLVFVRINPGDVHQLARNALSLFHDNLSLFHLFGYPLPDRNIKHLLDLVHSCYRPSAKGIEEHRVFQEKAAREPASQRSMKFIGSGTELDDAGIFCFFGDTMMED